MSYFRCSDSGGLAKIGDTYRKHTLTLKFCLTNWKFEQRTTHRYSGPVRTVDRHDGMMGQQKESHEFL